MNLQEMIDQVSDELRNTTIESKITRWINLAIIDIATGFIFGHLNSYGSEVTVVGTPDITLNDDFLWLKSTQIPTGVIGLKPIDEQKLANSNPNYRTQQGTTQWYYLNGIKMGLWQVPSSILTITYNYQKRPLKLVDVIDTSDLPEEWHELVSEKATERGYKYEGNASGVNDSQAKQSRLLNKLGAHIYKRPDDNIVLGGDSFGSRPPRPRFPGNYPRVRY